jgi:hypothetical protein
MIMPPITKILQEKGRLQSETTSWKALHEHIMDSRLRQFPYIVVRTPLLMMSEFSIKIGIKFSIATNRVRFGKVGRAPT